MRLRRKGHAKPKSQILCCRSVVKVVGLGFKSAHGGKGASPDSLFIVQVSPQAVPHLAQTIMPSTCLIRSRSPICLSRCSNIKNVKFISGGAYM